MDFMFKIGKEVKLRIKKLDSLIDITKLSQLPDNNRAFFGNEIKIMYNERLAS